MLVIILTALVLVLLSCGLLLRTMARSRLKHYEVVSSMRLATGGFCALCLSAVLLGIVLTVTGDLFSILLLAIVAVLAERDYRLLDQLHAFLAVKRTVAEMPVPRQKEE